MVRIDDIISYIPACDEPLSADVGVITGIKKTWLFDVMKKQEHRNRKKEICMTGKYNF